LLDGDIGLLKEENDNFIKKVERLIELQKEFGALDTSDFPDEAMKIESMLFSPDHVDEIKEHLTAIKNVHRIKESGKSFDTFIIGACNKNAVDIYKEQVLKNLGEKFNPFLIFGGKGTGKTRFLEAVYNDLINRDKSVKFSDLASKERISRLGDTEQYDVLLFDNFHHTFSAQDELRKKIFDSIQNFIKAGKAVICSLAVSPSDLSLSDDEKSILEFGIETEFGAPSPDVVEAYIKSKLELNEAEKVLNGGVSGFTSFYEIDEFLDSTKTEESQKMIPLGFSGEEDEQEKEDQEKEEVEEIVVSKETEEEMGEEKLTITKAEVPKNIKEERFIIQEISGELIEDNY